MVFDLIFALIIANILFGLIFHPKRCGKHRFPKFFQFCILLESSWCMYRHNLLMPFGFWSNQIFFTEPHCTTYKSFQCQVDGIFSNFLPVSSLHFLLALCTRPKPIWDLILIYHSNGPVNNNVCRRLTDLHEQKGPRLQYWILTAYLFCLYNLKPGSCTAYCHAWLDTKHLIFDMKSPITVFLDTWRRCQVSKRSACVNKASSR